MSRNYIGRKCIDNYCNGHYYVDDEYILQSALYIKLGINTCIETCIQMLISVSIDVCIDVRMDRGYRHE